MLMGFALRCLLLSPIVLVLWWTVSPQYAWVLGQICSPLINIFNDPNIRALFVRSEGIFNTNTVLILRTMRIEQTLDIAYLINNVPALIILSIATGSITWGRRLKILAIGGGILFASHVLFIVGMYTFSESAHLSSEIAVSLGQFLVTLPFVIWIVLAYWDKLGALFDEPAENVEN